MKNCEFESADICTKVLVIKQKGKISAFGNKCSHYGALLSMGVLGDGRVRCPWYVISQIFKKIYIINFLITGTGHASI